LGNIYLLDGVSPNTVHARVYADALAIHDEGARFRLITDERGGAAIRARDPNSFLQYLPWYATRPAYIGAGFLLYKTGIPPVSSLMLVSSISYLCVALILVVWLKKYFQPRMALLFSFLIAFSLADMAKQATPDMMSCALLLLASYLIVEGGAYSPGVTLLVVSLMIRPDNIVLLFVVSLFLWANNKIPFTTAASACLIGAALVALLNRFNYSWAFLFQQTFYGPFPYPAEVVPHVTTRMYLHTLLASAWEMFRSFPYVAILLAIAATNKGKLQSFFFVALASSILHFLLYPDGALRYYMLTVVVGTMAAVTTVAPVRPALSTARRGWNVGRTIAQRVALAPDRGQCV